MRPGWLVFLLVLNGPPAPSSAGSFPPLSAGGVQEARAAARPVALLVSRRACPRCSLLETVLRDPQVVAVLDGRFSALAVDADERPDLAGALADSLLILPNPRHPADPGLSFLMVVTPDLRPLDGTSLARDGGALPASSLLAFLVRLADLWDADRSALEVRGGLVQAALREAQDPGPPLEALTAALLDRPRLGLRDAFDRRRGAFGLPPRRIPHGALRFLLEEDQRTSDPSALALATAVLDAILSSPLRGSALGFSREAAGDDWSRPTLEQTLADNALLLRALVGAHEATGTVSYAEAAAGIAGFLKSTLADEAGGFRHALAQDRGGELRDDRVFAYANGLAVGALARSGRSLGRAEDLRSASQAAEAVLSRLGPAGGLARLAEGADRRGSAVLADHAYLAEGLLDLYDATLVPRWREQARALVEAALSRYADPIGGGFYESAEDGEIRPARRRDAYDGVLPAANAVMVSVLRRMGRATGEKLYTDLARRTALAFARDLSRAPSGLESLAASVGELLGDEPAAQKGESGAAGAGRTAADSRATRGPVTFEAVVEPGRVRPGGTAQVSVRLRLAAGSFVVAHRALPPGTKPRDAPDVLPLAVAFPGTAYKVGAPSYPAGSPVSLAGSPAPVLAHTAPAGPDGEAAVIVAPFAVPPGGAGPSRLRIRVSFQACNARACSAPDNVTLEAPFSVEP